MSQFLEDMQYKLKTSSSSLVIGSFKFCVGLFLGLTFALIFQRAFDLGDFSFALIIITTAGIFVRVARPWTLISLMIFTFICVLVGVILRMYIQLAPGA